MFRRIHVTHRHLVTAPISFALLTVDLGRTSPSFRRSQDNHRPDRASAEASRPCLAPDLFNLTRYCFQSVRHLLVHLKGIVTLDKIGFVAISLEQSRELLARNTSEKARICYFVPVEMQNR